MLATPRPNSGVDTLTDAWAVTLPMPTLPTVTSNEVVQSLLAEHVAGLGGIIVMVRVTGPPDVALQQVVGDTAGAGHPVQVYPGEHMTPTS